MCRIWATTDYQKISDLEATEIEADLRCDGLINGTGRGW